MIWAKDKRRGGTARARRTSADPRALDRARRRYAKEWERMKLAVEVCK